MRVTMRPSAAPDRELDLSHALVSAVAAELWRNFGGNEVVNWMEAERFVESLLMSGPTASAAPEPRTIEPRPRHKPARPREDAPRTSRRLLEDDRVTGPLPVY
jgi:hypothetical protein